MFDMRQQLIKIGAVLALGLSSVGCGKLYNYTPAGVNHNSDRFGRDTGKIEKEINSSFDKVSERFNLIVQRYLGLKISKIIADMLARNDLELEDLEAFLDDSRVEGENRSLVLEEYRILMAEAELEEEAEGTIFEEPLKDELDREDGHEPADEDDDDDGADEERDEES